MNNPSNRREFLKTSALAGAAVTFPISPAEPSAKSLLVFTKSSGFEHQVVKRSDGKLSICETVVTELGKKHGFQVECSKDGRIFDSSEFHSFQGALFFTTGDLTESGTDKNPRHGLHGSPRGQRYISHPAGLQRPLNPLRRLRRKIRSLPAHARRRIHHSR